MNVLRSGRRTYEYDGHLALLVTDAEMMEPQLQSTVLVSTCNVAVGKILAR